MIMRLSVLRKGIVTAMTVGSIATLALTTYNLNGSANAAAAHKPLLVGSRMPPSVLSIVERACQDCHSGNTHWPWYSKLPPLSWKIHKDVAQARVFMDLSKWNEYTLGYHLKSGHTLSLQNRPTDLHPEQEDVVPCRL